MTRIICSRQVCIICIFHYANVCRATVVPADMYYNYGCKSQMRFSLHNHRVPYIEKVMLRRDFVHKCDRGFFDCISECAKNVLKGNVPLTDRQKTKLRRSQNDLRELLIKKTALRNKRRILQKVAFSALYCLRYSAYSPICFFSNNASSQETGTGRRIR